MVEVKKTRSAHWEYLGFVLVGVGVAFCISGSIALFYLQQHPSIHPQYAPYPVPLLIAGSCIIFPGAAALIYSRMKKTRESSEDMIPPPPPPLPPPPPS